MTCEGSSLANHIELFSRLQGQERGKRLLLNKSKHSRLLTPSFRGVVLSVMSEKIIDPSMAIEVGELYVDNS